MIRIKYKQSQYEKFLYKSVDKFLLGKNLVEIVIDLKLNKLYLMDKAKTIYEEKGKHFKQMQRRARTVLKKLGVDLQDESRKVVK